MYYEFARCLMISYCNDIVIQLSLSASELSKKARQLFAVNILTANAV